MDNRPLSQIYHDVGEQWADAEAAATIQEDLKSAFVSQKIQEYMTMDPKMALNKAEATVKASPEWKSYVEKTVALRKKANYLKVQLTSIKMQAGEQASEEANHRAATRL